MPLDEGGHGGGPTCGLGVAGIGGHGGIIFPVSQDTGLGAARLRGWVWCGEIGKGGLEGYGAEPELGRNEWGWTQVCLMEDFWQKPKRLVVL